ncbi:MAG: glycosyl transferase family 1, partial [Candidatus Rokubacteria bacterium]|nr:glycosyl transferase family 1 [Candidatus Rokubacteria bacterium]
MLPRVSIGRHCCAASVNLENHRRLVGDELIDEIRSLAGDLKGVRICHVNATAFGGGVAELLSRHLPLLQALGLSVEWRLIHGEPEFFTVTKAFHNALQGAEYEPDERARALYLEMNGKAAELLETAYDIFVVHDPQPAALRHFAGPRDARWIWLPHRQLGAQSEGARLPRPLHRRVRRAGLHHAGVPPAPPGDPARGLHPPRHRSAGDQEHGPLARPLQTGIADAGIDLTRPLLAQVSRFDPWKDPLGVVDAYRIVKRQIPELQLVMVASMASDDPEGWSYFERTARRAGEDFDVHLLSNLNGVGNLEVGAFQRASAVVVQK